METCCTHEIAAGPYQVLTKSLKSINSYSSLVHEKLKTTNICIKTVNHTDNFIKITKTSAHHLPLNTYH